MNLEDRLAEAFRAKAATAKTSPEAFTTIRDRVRRQRRWRMLELAGAGLAVPAVVSVVLIVNKAAFDEPRIDTTPSVTATSPTPSGSPSATTSPSAKPTTSAPVIPPTSTDKPAESPYADAIAVARPGGIVELMSPSGTVLTRLADFKSGTVRDLEWAPDRSEVYVTFWHTVHDTVCTPGRAIAVDVSTRKTRVLGLWSDVAFSADGTKLAAIEHPTCHGERLLVRDLTTGQERRLAKPPGDEAPSYGDLVWVPGVDRVVLGEWLGDNVALLLVDLATDNSLQDGTRLDLESIRSRGEVPRAHAYVGSRLIIAADCCSNALDPEHVRFLERNGATGRLQEQLSLPRRFAANLAGSPDGTRLVYQTGLDRPDPGAEPVYEGLWVWELGGSPKKIADGDFHAVAW